MTVFKEHRPVLVKEVIQGLAIKPSGIYIDLTFGRGGHSREILRQLSTQGRLIAIDRDPFAVESAKSKDFCDPRFSIYHAAFSQLQSLVTQEALKGEVSGVLFDLGVSSPQLEDPKRGFSFMQEGPLDMRMNIEDSMDAATWLNRSSRREIERVLREYGEERYSRRIAIAIVKERGLRPFKTTKQLVKLLAHVMPTRESGKHFATRTFQAIRIAVNRELEELERSLEQCLNVLEIGGRIVVIAFHSLEDRIVKRFFKKESTEGNYPVWAVVPDFQLQRRLRIVSPLIRPTQKEIKLNYKARSACLRIAEKL